MKTIKLLTLAAVSLNIGLFVIWFGILGKPPFENIQFSVTLFTLSSMAYLFIRACQVEVVRNSASWNLLWAVAAVAAGVLVLEFAGTLGSISVFAVGHDSFFLGLAGLILLTLEVSFVAQHILRDTHCQTPEVSE